MNRIFEVFIMEINKLDEESYIATKAAEVLRDTFVKVARNGKVIYVQNDAIWSKVPKGTPVLVKLLSGRNPDLSKKIANRATFKIKKKNINN